MPRPVGRTGAGWSGREGQGRAGGAAAGSRRSRRQQLGRLGEEAAATYLQARGYVILARNFRCRFGEIDIVARQGKTVAFVEVRTRTGDAFGSPEESIDARKRARLKRLATYYLYLNNLSDADCRFDVVAITVDREGKPQRIEIFANAFA